MPKSCDEYFAFSGSNKTVADVNVLLDIDGQGPLQPIRVKCKQTLFTASYTIINHDQSAPVDVQGFSGRGEGQIVFNYDVPRSSLLELICRHNKCSQELVFECFGGTRLNTSPSTVDSNKTLPVVVSPIIKLSPLFKLSPVVRLLGGWVFLQCTLIPGVGPNLEVVCAIAGDWHLFK